MAFSALASAIFIGEKKLFSPLLAHQKFLYFCTLKN